MQPYRKGEPQPESSPPTLSYDYSAQLDADRKRVVTNTFKILLCLAGPLGLIPRRWLAQVDLTLYWAFLLMLLLVAAVLAIRHAQSNSLSDIEAYEERLLRAKRRKMTNRKRRR